MLHYYNKLLNSRSNKKLMSMGIGYNAGIKVIWFGELVNANSKD
jgi:Fe2+ transport system protein FeoA